MKLELEHIAPYLPYGLKFIHKLNPNIIKVATGISYDKTYDFHTLEFQDNYWLDELAKLPDGTDDRIRSIYKSNLNKRHGEIMSNVRLLLRPLSDLTKEIEVNGERFVPVEKLYNGKLNEWKNELEINGIFYDYVMEMHEHDLLAELQYREISMLFEWHFDIFGLIEKGLAIDINI